MRKRSLAVLVAASLWALPVFAQPDGFGGQCLAAPHDAPVTAREQEVADLVDSLRPALARFESLARALAEGAPEICLVDALLDAQGYLGVEENRIVLRAALAPPMRQAVLIHELRHLHQARTGACPGPALSMGETARATLSLEADATAVTLHVAWALRAEGAPAVWDALAAWPGQQDIAAAFAGAMAETSDPVRAAARAFAQWYVSDWRRETYRIAACADYLDRQDRSHALPAYGALPQGFLSALCTLPDGRAYPCTPPASE
ncbi:DUF6782 family putative metallopeptidase [Rhodosalinus sp. 5P4]|uniref:DUF6782 family putative metallopeptidase n=1 Tax=Rhodosalinus sp. 5P4 TaxID=3239196 RepID=UPI003526C14A